MPVIRELRDSDGQLDAPSGFIAGAVRVFDVSANTGESAITDPELPAFLAAYSGTSPKLLATGFNVSPNPIPGTGGGLPQWRVRVTYTFQGNGQQPQPENQIDPSYRDDAGELVHFTVTVPFITKRSVSLSGEPPADFVGPIPAAFVDVYDFSEYKVSITGVSRTIKLNLPANPLAPNALNPNTFDAAVLSQGDKLHIIDGVVYRFEGGRYYRRDVNTYGVEYQWVTEPGNPSLTARLEQAGADIIDVPARAPFEKYSVIPVGPPFLERFSIQTYAERLTEANGYLTLPGVS